MNCTRVRQMLDAFIDGELDPATNADIEAHLGGCQDCARARTERHALVGRIGADAPYYSAPLALRAAIDRKLDRAGEPPRRIPARPTWLQTGALAAARPSPASCSALQSINGPKRTPCRTGGGQHVASLAPPRRLVDVESSDRHVVKPWLIGKIDFAPPVLDLEPYGFTLLGARLDRVGNRQAAAVVYRIRNHDINLFVWRAAREGTRTEAELTAVRGFGVASWTQNGLMFVAVSDVDRRDLQKFVDALRQ